jgi:membrane protease YdiL (CAAX protease family)
MLPSLALILADGNDHANSISLFGIGDWLFIVWNIVLFVLGIGALQRGYGQPGEDHPRQGLQGWGASIWGAGSVVFLFFGTVYLVAGILTGLATQLHLIGDNFGERMIPQFLGQLAGAAVYVAASFAFKGSVYWSPSLVGETHHTSVMREIEGAAKAFNVRSWINSFLAVATLLVVATMISQLFIKFCALQGTTLPDEPQVLIEEILHWEGPRYKLIFVFLALGVGAPIVEELAFRGVLYPSLKGWMPRGYAIIITGIIFAIIHGSLSALFPLFVFGSFLCLVRDRYGLFTSMALHALLNIHTFFWLLVAPEVSSRF